MNNNMIRSSTDFTQLHVVPTYIYNSIKDNVSQDIQDELESLNKKIQPDANIFTKIKVKAHEEKNPSKKKNNTTINLSKTSNTMDESTLQDTTIKEKKDDEDSSLKDQSKDDSTVFHTPSKTMVSSTPKSNSNKKKKNLKNKKNISLGVKKSKLVAGDHNVETESIPGSSTDKSLLNPPFPEKEDEKSVKKTASGRITKKPEYFGRGIKYHLFS